MDASSPPLERLWSASGILLQAALLLGILLAVAEKRVGAWLLLAAVVGLVAAHLAISLVAYRQIMRRPWPQVEPLSDDDWDD
jgi:hypothetical protein